MVEGTPIYHPRVLRPIDALARYYPRQAAKEQIRARNQRVTDYDPRDISVMARALLHTQPEHFMDGQGRRAWCGKWRRRLLPKRRAKRSRSSPHHSMRLVFRRGFFAMRETLNSEICILAKVQCH